MWWLLLACAPLTPKGGGDSGGALDTGRDEDGASPTGGAVCGDGRRDPGEECDEGDINGASACGCQKDCRFGSAGTVCEDGDLCTEGEACDGAGACTGARPLDCEDGDPCSEDACDPAVGACTHRYFVDGETELFDMEAIRDPSTLEVEVRSTSTVWEGLTPVEVREIRYTSWQREDCVLSPIRVEAYLAIAGEGPGMAVAHGLGGWAEAGHASTPAADIGGVAIAWSGPGQGGSEGTGSTPDHLFDTWPDPRDSWFWEHAVAGMRALTVLETIPQVDASRMGMTGYSGGGVVTLMANGTDDRIDLAVPISATGYLDMAARATPNPGWEADLLAAMSPPRTVDSIEWDHYVRYLDPANFLERGHGDVLLINGAQDEFFPISSLVATFDGLSASGRDLRLLAIKDWDHGWFSLFNSEEPARKAAESWEMWVGHNWGLSSSFAALPPMPAVVSVSPWTCSWPGAWWITWSCAVVVAELPGLSGYDVEGVQFHWSVDQALSFSSWNLQEHGGYWWAEVGTMDGAVYDARNTVWFVEAEFSTGLFGPGFSLTSRPSLPDGFSPYILPATGALPI